ncbi:MAG TPA: L-seryl-tRNA(Sec) selenium transferase [Bacillota bacterium]|jgi:L-seryl-tRNA(Ser) seleniumtransferase|nr:L-seryl-tRNA(Sec) selenium transferase [Fastidiosipila sp.]HPX93096.1 L-seryl-tRNA(Sec) selenium transferase [Bacillota bacterium]HQB80831.1 L-seryl-tRNA(Sec) selenium transferase [Bacillota bacterium]
MIIENPRDLPKVDQLLRDSRLDAARESNGYHPVREAVRGILEAARHFLTKKADDPLADAAYIEKAAGADCQAAGSILLSEEVLLRAILLKIETESKPGIRKVINATGAILHTNLGRAPLAKEALAAVQRCSEGYASLEFDLTENRRGQRTAPLETLLCRLFDVEAATVVNNNAAAVMLALSALCRGREVLVSRGELVEIGGKFRVPEIMEESGAILREVGTTNKTRLADYERAISDSTAALLKVHRSNFRISGFTEDVSDTELSQLARCHGIPLIYDLGSGLVSEELSALLPDEPTVRGALASGADLICFSGDKLLGGPQAGILMGRADLVGKMTAHPLMRAFRCDKMTLAALEATLALYLDPDRAKERIPLLVSVLYNNDSLRQRTEEAALSLSGHGIMAEAIPSEIIMGGGSAPEIPLHSWALAVRSGTRSISSLEQNLRAFDPPILCRTTLDTLLFDLRTLSGEEERLLLSALARAFSEETDLP